MAMFQWIYVVLMSILDYGICFSATLLLKSHCMLLIGLDDDNFYPCNILMKSKRRLILLILDRIGPLPCVAHFK